MSFFLSLSIPGRWIINLSERCFIHSFQSRERRVGRVRRSKDDLTYKLRINYWKLLRIIPRFLLLSFEEVCLELTSSWPLTRVDGWV